MKILGWVYFDRTCGMDICEPSGVSSCVPMDGCVNSTAVQEREPVYVMAA